MTPQDGRSSTWRYCDKKKHSGRIRNYKLIEKEVDVSLIQITRTSGGLSTRVTAGRR